MVAGHVREISTGSKKAAGFTIWSIWSVWVNWMAVVADGVTGMPPNANTNTNYFVHIASERRLIALGFIGRPTLPICKVVRPRHRLRDKSFKITAALSERREVVAGGAHGFPIPFDEGATLNSLQILENFVQITPEISRLNECAIRLTCPELCVHSSDCGHTGAVARRVGLGEHAVIEDLEDISKVRPLRAQYLFEQSRGLDRAARVRPLRDVAS